VESISSSGNYSSTAKEKRFSSFGFRCLPPCTDIYTDDAKAVMGKISGVIA